MSGSLSPAFADAPNRLINPLDVYAQTIQAQGNALDVRQKAANQAASQVLQQATDRNTGVTDYLLAGKLAAQAGPEVGIAMSGLLKDASALRGAQINQASDHYNLFARTALDIARNPSDQNVNDQADSLIRAGYPADQVNAERQAYLALPLDQRKERAYTHTVSALDAQTGLSRTVGETRLVQMLQGVVPATVMQPTPNSPGGMTQPPGGFTAGIAPAPGYVPDPRPGAPPGSYVPAIPPGGGGTQPLPQGAPAATPSGAPAPGAAAPPLPPGAPPLPQGTHLSGGRFGPAPAAQPSAPAAASTTAAPAAGPTFTAPPAQQEDVLKKDIDTRTAANLAVPDQQKRLIAGQTALEALKLANGTGPGTAELSRAAAFLQAQGITSPPQGNMSPTDYREVLVKNLLRFADSSAKTSGTDLGLTTKLHESASADELLPAANRHVLLQDLGILKRDIAQTREMPEASANGAVVKHIGSFSGNYAPEAFMWSEYSNDERAAIKADYAKKGQTEKLENSVKLAQKHGLIPPPPQAAPPPPVPQGRPAAALPNMLNPYA